MHVYSSIGIAMNAWRCNRCPFIHMHLLMHGDVICIYIVINCEDLLMHCYSISHCRKKTWMNKLRKHVNMFLVVEREIVCIYIYILLNLFFRQCNFYCSHIMFLICRLYICSFSSYTF